MNKNHIRQISEQSKSEKWPFPKTFETLKSEGVMSYRFDVPTCETVFMGDNGIAYSELLAGAERIEIAPTLDADAVAPAIKRHIANHTPFLDFRIEAARAGVEYWEVAMDARTVTYVGVNGDKHVEQVPALAAE